jgi:hypothetical protein
MEKLIEECPTCLGAGGGLGYVCSDCHGKGRRPTREGRAIINLLEEFLPPRLEAVERAVDESKTYEREQAER